jgi:broad specificity phosphatase PhoE
LTAIPVPQVLIIRHGESLWNAEHRWQGWKDIALNDQGEAEAAARARELAHDGFKPRAVYASDLKRAARTGEIISAHLEAPFVTDRGFRERCGGDWEGHTSDEINEKWPGLLDRWRAGEIHSPPNGETIEDVFVRFDAALLRALAHVGTGMLLITTHGGVLWQVAERAGAPKRKLPVENLGGYWFDVVDGALCNPVQLDTLRVDAEPPDLE